MPPVDPFLHSEALEAAILAEPGALSRWSIYADWLLAQGDPRGAVLALAVKARQAGDEEERAALETLVAQARAPLLPALLGSPLRVVHGVQLEWLGPFVRALTVIPTYAAEWMELSSMEVALPLLRAPASRLLHRLLVDVPGPPNLAFVDALAGAVPPSVRELSLLRLYGSDEANLSAVFAACPQLSSLSLSSVVLQPGQGVPQGLRSLTLREVHPRERWVEALEVGLAQVHTLALGDFPWLDVRRVLLASPRPGLRRLELTLNEPDAALVALAASPLVEQLEELRVAGPVGDAGVQALLDARSRLSRLKRLRLSYARVSEGLYYRATRELPSMLFEVAQGQVP